MSELSERMREFREASWEPTLPDTVEELDLMWRQSLEIFEIGAEDLETKRAAWKEAFLATRAYYSNNNGPNATRYRAAIKQLKEMKLIK